MSRVTCEVRQLTCVSSQIDQRFTVLAVRIYAVLVTIAAHHATLSHGYPSVHHTGLRHVVLDHDEVAPSRNGLARRKRPQARTRHFGTAADARHFEHGGKNIDAYIGQMIGSSGGSLTG